MLKPKIYFADLTHMAQGLSAPTFPLGISYVLSYAKSQLRNDFEFRLFKFPDALEVAIKTEPPQVLCFSNFSWNLELSYKIATLAKKRDPSLVTVFGGPNFPVSIKEKLSFLRQRPDLDFYIELEGELGLVDLLHYLADKGFDFMRLKKSQEAPLNTNYVWEDELILGPVERIRDLSRIPSPYLSGIMDEFFALPLVPMIETTRGCPFTCTFCADGLDMKNKVVRHPPERTVNELEYIAQRVNKIDSLIITDLNFAMYKEDLQTAVAVREVQERYGYPTLVSASAGKNKPERTIEVSEVISGWTLGASIQSTDPEVLKAIKRSNISSLAYQELIQHGNRVDDSKTHSEIILGLPDDTKEKHFQSLRFGVENNVNHIRMFQAIMLPGTEMASEATRTTYGLNGKYRTIPGCVGVYEFFDESHVVAEIEEIIVGSKTLSWRDYLDCRVMNLLVETFHNNAMFEELFAVVRYMGASPFNCLVYIKDNPQDYSPRIQEIIHGFVEQTSEGLYTSFEEAKAHTQNLEVANRYVGGELGTNELLLHRAMLYLEFEDICDLLFNAASRTLDKTGRLTEPVSNYLDELRRFIGLRKQDLFTNTECVLKTTFSYDFESIQEVRFAVDPTELPTFEIPQEFCFYHSLEQQRHISNEERLYLHTPIGLGRLLQRSNLKLMYRSFSRTTPLTTQVSAFP